MSWYRIYFVDEDGNDDVREVELKSNRPITKKLGRVLRICDDHGRVVSGEPLPKREKFIGTYGGREPRYYN